MITSFHRPKKLPDVMTNAELEEEISGIKSVIATTEADAAGQHANFDWYDIQLRQMEEMLDKFETEKARRNPSS